MEPRAAAATEWRQEGAWLGTFLAGFAAALALEHWFVHRAVILPSLEAAGGVQPWMWAALFAPEIVVAFVAGWRLRSWALVAAYAVSAALVRGGSELLLARLGEPGHVRAGAPISEFAVGAPLAALAYLGILAAASSSGRAEGQLDGAQDDRA